MLSSGSATPAPAPNSGSRVPSDAGARPGPLQHCLVAELLGEIAQGPDDRGEGEAVAAERDALATNDARLTEPGAERFDERRLADARIAAEQDRRAPAAAHDLEGLDQSGELLVPTDDDVRKDARRHEGHRTEVTVLGHAGYLVA